MSSSTFAPLRFLWFGYDGSGSNTPALAMSTALLNAGHSLLYVGIERQRPYFERNHIPFAVLPKTEAGMQSLGIVGKAVPEGPVAMQAMMGLIFANPDHPVEMDEHIAAYRPDRIIIDCVMLGCQAAMELRAARGQSSIPSFLYYHSTISAQTLGLHPVMAPVNAMRAQLGLPPAVDLYDAAKRSAVTRTLCVSVKGLETSDFLPRLEPDIQSGWLRYIGPQVPAPSSAIHVEGSYETSWADWRCRVPWAVDDPRPLVVVAFSTVPQVGPFNERSHIESALAALDGQPCRVVCTSARTDVDGLAIPANAAVFPYIPHSELLPLARAAVIHGGHGTVIATAMHGVPSVLRPNNTDQPILAQRLHDLKAGIRLDDDATIEQIREAVLSLLNEPHFRAAAVALQEEMKEAMEANRALGFWLIE